MRAATIERFREIRAATVALAAPLSAEDCQVQAAPHASPVKWHLAHTTWFFETFVLAHAEREHRPFHPAFRALFNSYYVGIGPSWQRPQRGLLTRPSLDEVHAYRAYADERVAELLGRADLEAGLAWRIELGLNHEQQHQELLLTDVKLLLGTSPLLPAYRAHDAAAGFPAPALEWLGFEGGLTTIGHDGDGFAFDNESPRHRVVLEPYELASRPATNREWLAFQEDDGYARPELWLSEGWDAVRANGWRAPLHWHERDSGWIEYTLAGPRALDPEAPVCHVSWYEAEAFARWSGARLPSEAEWEHAARAHAGAVPALSRIADAVWQWTASSYAPYPGFRPFEGEIGEYNGKFMCNQYVLRGGSSATPRGHARLTYRNFFHPDARWQFSGVRLAR